MGWVTLGAANEDLVFWWGRCLSRFASSLVDQWLAWCCVTGVSFFGKLKQTRLFFVDNTQQSQCQLIVDRIRFSWFVFSKNVRKIRKLGLLMWDWVDVRTYRGDLDAGVEFI